MGAAKSKEPWRRGGFLLGALALLALCGCERETDKGRYVELALNQQQAEELGQQQKYASQLETADKQQERADRQLERYEQQMQRTEALLSRNERFTQRQEALLARQEKQADRYDRLLDAWEAQNRARERSP